MKNIFLSIHFEIEKLAWLLSTPLSLCPSETFNIECGERPSKKSNGVVQMGLFFQWSDSNLLFYCQIFSGVAF